VTQPTHDEFRQRAEQAAAELEDVRRSFPMGVKPALVKTLAAVDGQAYGRLPVAARKRYREQADAVLRLMGWHEKQLIQQLEDALKALRDAKDANAELRRMAEEGR